MPEQLSRCHAVEWEWVRMGGICFREQFSPRISLDMMVCCGMMTGDPRCTSVALVQAMQQSK